MVFSRISSGTKGLALVLVSAWLTGCAMPPANETELQASPETEAAAAASNAAEQAAAEASMARQAEMRRELTEAGVQVTTTQEGRIKLSVPSDVSFALGSATVQRSAGKLLSDIADVLNKHPNTFIEIIGHTDSSGSDAVNLPLSTKRAESTRDVLVKHKVAADRFTTQGWGADQPIADNATAEGRSANRRVELFITEH